MLLDLFGLSYSQIRLFFAEVLYVRGKCILIDAIMKDQLKKQSVEEIEKMNRVKKPISKIKEGTSNPSAKKSLICE